MAERLTRKDFSLQVDAFQKSVEAKAIEAKALLAGVVQAYKEQEGSFPEENFVYSPAPINSTRSSDIHSEPAFYINFDNLDQGRIAHIMLMEDSTLRRYWERRYLPKNKDGIKRKPNYNGESFEELSDLDYVIWVPSAARTLITHFKK